MGTNYYAIAPACENACEHCAKQTEWHICKSLTMFEAHEISPWGKIADWSDWRQLLLDNFIVIKDEYNRTHEPAQFIADVEATGPDQRGGQHRWLVSHGYDLRDDYLDSHGFSWHRGEFS